MKPASGKSEKETTSMFRILVVDDNVALCVNLKDILEETGYHVDTVHSGNDAIALSQKNKYDMALVDIVLGDITGHEVVNKISKLSPSTEFIFMTGHASLESAVEACRQGNIISYEVKPIKMDHILSIMKQVAERKQAETALILEKQRIEDVTSNVNCGLFLLDDQVRIIYANRVAEKWFGPLDRIKGKACWKVFYVKEPEKKCAGLKVLKTGKISQSETFMKMVSGEERYFYEVASPVKDNEGRICHINAVIVDITDRKKAENALGKARQEIERWNEELEMRVKLKTEELEKSHAQLIQSEKLSVMGQMAAGLAHELNSPLAGLLPMLEKHRNKAGEGSEEHMELNLMLKAANHMAKIVKDFGVFSRKSKGLFTSLSVNEIVDDTLSFGSVKLRNRGIQIVKELDARLPLVKGDKTWLQQVVLNMITNAADAMKEGGEIIIKTLVSKDENKVLIQFTDSGIGIDKNNLNKIFDPFFTTKESGKGTGLGLAVSHEIIEKHGGGISVESEPGKGTKFTISLPALESSR